MTPTFAHLVFAMEKVAQAPIQSGSSLPMIAGGVGLAMGGDSLQNKALTAGGLFLAAKYWDQLPPEEKARILGGGNAQPASGAPLVPSAPPGSPGTVDTSQQLLPKEMRGKPEFAGSTVHEIRGENGAMIRLVKTPKPDGTYALHDYHTRRNFMPYENVYKHFDYELRSGNAPSLAKLSDAVPTQFSHLANPELNMLKDPIMIDGKPTAVGYRSVNGKLEAYEVDSYGGRKPIVGKGNIQHVENHLRSQLNIAPAVRMPNGAKEITYPGGEKRWVVPNPKGGGEPLVYHLGSNTPLSPTSPGYAEEMVLAKTELGKPIHPSGQKVVDLMNGKKGIAVPTGYTRSVPGVSDGTPLGYDIYEWDPAKGARGRRITNTEALEVGHKTLDPNYNKSHNRGMIDEWKKLQDSGPGLGTHIKAKVFRNEDAKNKILAHRAQKADLRAREIAADRSPAGLAEDPFKLYRLNPDAKRVEARFTRGRNIARLGGAATAAIPLALAGYQIGDMLDDEDSSKWKTLLTTAGLAGGAYAGQRWAGKNIANSLGEYMANRGYGSRVAYNDPSRMLSQNAINANKLKPVSPLLKNTGKLLAGGAALYALSQGLGWLNKKKKDQTGPREPENENRIESPTWNDWLAANKDALIRWSRTGKMPDALWKGQPLNRYERSP